MAVTRHREPAGFDWKFYARRREPRKKPRPEGRGFGTDETSQPPFFLISAFASSSSTGPLLPFSDTSLNHSVATPSVAFCHRAYSAGESVSNTPPASAASFLPGTVVPSNTFPICFDHSSPVLASITFLTSGGRLSYFAGFMAITKMEFDILGTPASVSR